MTKRTRDLFITFEGTEGSGKSTLIRHLKEALTKLGYSVCVTREPGGPIVAEEIRALILKDFKTDQMHSMTELFLYEAARAEHLEKVIRPALKKGQVVLCDRFTDSTFAYQGVARGVDLKLIDKLNAIATGGLKPTVTVLLDLDPKEGLKRASDPNRFELEGIKFHQKVRNGFIKAAKRDQKRFLVLSVLKKTPEELCSQVIAHLKKRKYVSN